MNPIKVIKDTIKFVKDNNIQSLDQIKDLEVTNGKIKKKDNRPKGKSHGYHR